MRLIRFSVSATALAMGIAISSGHTLAADALPPQQDDSYISVFGGWNWAREQVGYDASQYDVKLKDGFTVGAAYGRHIGNGFRWESEISFVGNNHDGYRTDNGAYDTDISDDVYSLFVLGNIWKDFNLTDSVQPYVGAGLGTAISGSENHDNGNWKGSSVALAGQVGAGLRVALSDKLALDAGYRLRMAIDATTDSIDGDNNSVFSHYSHTAQLGVTYAMGDGQVMSSGSGDPSDWYVSLFGGAVKTTSNYNYSNSSQYLIDHKTGFTVGGALGTHMAPGLRAELELSYLRSALDSYTTTTDTAAGPASGDLSQVYLLANLWRDINLGGSITPYIGGGVGIGFISFDDGVISGDNLTDDTGVGLAAQVGIGARMAISDNLSVDVGYRFKSIVDALLIGGNDWTDNGELAATNHVFQIGVNYGLGGANDAPPIMEQNHYVTLFGGGVFPVDTHGNVDGHDYIADFKTGFTVGAALGSNITDNLRGEVEASFQKFSVDQTNNGNNQPAGNGDVKGYFLMANLWRDMEIGPFKPYAGGGVGLGLMDVYIDWEGNQNNHVSDGNTLALALQVGSGIRYDMTDNLTLDLGYRFKAVNAVNTKDFTISNTNYNSSSYYTQTVQAGVTWNF